jgi:hypothetical protein
MAIRSGYNCEAEEGAEIRSYPHGCQSFLSQMAGLIDLAGGVFARLTVIARAPNTPNGSARWVCRCECGTETTVDAVRIRNGITKSCGCFRREFTAKQFTTHGASVGLTRKREYQLWCNAKMRARRDGLAFNLEVGDIAIPEVCPLLGVPLHVGARGILDNSPSIDRFDSSLGYVKGNIWVISHRANRIKADATIDELERILTALRLKVSAA